MPDNENCDYLSEDRLFFFIFGWTGFFFWRIILFVYLQVDLLSVGGLAGKSSVDDLFHQESESERL